MYKIVLILSASLILLSASDTLSFSSGSVRNGESLLIIYKHKRQIRNIKLSFLNHAFHFLPHPSDSNLSYLILPVAYDTKAGNQPIALTYEDNGIKVREDLPPIVVEQGDYPKESLQVDPAKIRLSKKDKRRVEKEYLEASRLYGQITDTFYIDCQTCAPMDSAVTSNFGNERLFNGERKSYHSGIDYRAQTPSQIKAIGKGKVVLLSDRFYAGYSLVLDHGHGIYTGYFHLSKAFIKLGDTVNRDDVIALSGQSGRVTGPHLHFSMKIQGVTVNPKVVLDQINKLLQTSSL